MRHHVFLSPGIFGFARFAAYDYFGHVERALISRFDAAGHQLFVHVVDVLPTASIRRRASKLAGDISLAATGTDPVHLLGHSTGGLDARLVAATGVALPVAPWSMRWLPHLRSVTTMNTPHLGTPLASFFATSQGQRVLQLLSAFTIVGLAVGRRPLGLASVVLGLIGKGDGLPGMAALDRSVDAMRGLVDEARGETVRGYLAAIRDDQGAVLQLSPEAMELMATSVADRPGVVYQSTASRAPTPTAPRYLASLRHPSHAASLAVFAALHEVTARHDPRYPCAAVDLDGRPFAGAATEAALLEALGAAPALDDNDGVVPLRSQLHGRLILGRRRRSPRRARAAFRTGAGRGRRRHPYRDRLASWLAFTVAASTPSSTRSPPACSALLDVDGAAARPSMR
ncbi:MAG: hypothetical protein R2939_02585 [Kofleriaceae bacterium]